jgi:hypothetical protein
MKQIPRLLLLSAIALLALAPAAPADEIDEADLWTSLSDEGIHSLDQLVPGSTPPDLDSMGAPGPTRDAADSVETDSARLAVARDANDKATQTEISKTLDDPPSDTLAAPGQPSEWRGRGSYRSHYFDDHPEPATAAGTAAVAGAWPAPGGSPSDDANEAFDGDPYAYTSPEFENRQEALQRSGYGYGYDYGAAPASSGYGGPARPGDGRAGSYDDGGEDWDPDDGD